MIAAGPDALRVAIVLAFVALAVRDWRTRRIPRWVWIPILGVGVTALVWDTVAHRGLGGITWRLFAIRTAVSVGVVAPLGYVFYRLQAFGRADAKAIVAIGVAFPTYPILAVAGIEFPLVAAPLGVFSLTVLTNGVLLGLAYPLVLLALNLRNGRLSPWSAFGRPVHWSALPRGHGRLLEDQAGFTRTGLDLDALRMYCQWRSCSVGELRHDPGRFREPPTDPTAAVGDGRVATDGGDDPWGARAFLAAADGAYGTRPEELRAGLELVATREDVWVSPGIPFLVPLTAGMLVGMIAGDLFTVLLPLSTP